MDPVPLTSAQGTGIVLLKSVGVTIVRELIVGLVDVLLEVIVLVVMSVILAKIVGMYVSPIVLEKNVEGMAVAAAAAAAAIAKHVRAGSVFIKKATILTVTAEPAIAVLAAVIFALDLLISVGGIPSVVNPIVLAKSAVQMAVAAAAAVVDFVRRVLTADVNIARLTIPTTAVSPATVVPVPPTLVRSQPINAILNPIAVSAVLGQIKPAKAAVVLGIKCTKPEAVILRDVKPKRGA